VHSVRHNLTTHLLKSSTELRYIKVSGDSARVGISALRLSLHFGGVYAINCGCEKLSVHCGHKQKKFMNISLTILEIIPC